MLIILYKKYQLKIYTMVNKKNLIYFLAQLFLAYIIFIESYKYNNFLEIIPYIIVLVSIYYYIKAEPKNGIYIVLSVFLALFLIRIRNPIHYDDVFFSKEPINYNKYYFKNSDIYFIIPKYNNDSILNYPEECKRLKEYAQKNNKTLALHGLTHLRDDEEDMLQCEFLADKTDEEIKKGVNIFIKAFGFKPKYFKAPCYKINSNNTEKLNKMGIEVVTAHTLLFNKLYHERLPYDKFSYLIPYFNIISYLI